MSSYNFGFYIETPTQCQSERVPFIEELRGCEKTLVPCSCRMTNPQYQAGRLPGYVVQHAEGLHAELFQHADRRGMIGSYQAEDLR